MVTTRTDLFTEITKLTETQMALLNDPDDLSPQTHPINKKISGVNLFSSFVNVSDISIPQKFFVKKIDTIQDRMFKVSDLTASGYGTSSQTLASVTLLDNTVAVFCQKTTSLIMNIVQNDGTLGSDITITTGRTEHQWISACLLKCGEKIALTFSSVSPQNKYLMIINIDGSVAVAPITIGTHMGLTTLKHTNVKSLHNGNIAVMFNEYSPSDLYVRIYTDTGVVVTTATISTDNTPSLSMSILPNGNIFCAWAGASSTTALKYKVIDQGGNEIFSEKSITKGSSYAVNRISTATTRQGNIIIIARIDTAVTAFTVQDESLINEVEISSDSESEETKIELLTNDTLAISYVMEFDAIDFVYTKIINENLEILNELTKIATQEVYHLNTFMNGDLFSIMLDSFGNIDRKVFRFDSESKRITAYTVYFAGITIDAATDKLVFLTPDDAGYNCELDNIENSYNYEYEIKNIGAAAINITTAGSETIDGSSSYSLAGLYSVRLRQYDGTWRKL